MGWGALVIISKCISFSEDDFGLENSVESVLLKRAFHLGLNCFQSSHLD